MEMMERGRVKHIRHALLLVSYVLTRFQLASAVDIIFYPMRSCSGAGVSCINIGVGICCNYSPRASMRFRNSTSCKEGVVYRNGLCANQVGSFNGNVCVNGGGFTGGRWFDDCPSRRRQLLAGDGSAGHPRVRECTKFVNPNAVLYSEDPSKGTWVLKTGSAIHFLEQLETIPVAEKISWMKAQGAIYEPETQEGERTVIAF